MAEGLLFHQPQDLRPGFMAFADDLRQAEYTVHAPELS
jgi:hypothetical protein